MGRAALQQGAVVMRRRSEGKTPRQIGLNCRPNDNLTSMIAE
jgi:hypothetical protein